MPAPHGAVDCCPPAAATAGRLNPILDSLDRSYLYADNIDATCLAPAQ
ncbi:hypothetical protein [Candidatus Poriferisocius sp.]